jgi:hypothetical protein
MVPFPEGSGKAMRGRRGGRHGGDLLHAKERDEDCGERGEGGRGGAGHLSISLMCDIDIQ